MTELSRQTISGTVDGYVKDPGSGEKLDATFKDLTEGQQQEFQQLEERADNGDEEAAEELEKKIVNDFCLNNISYADTGVALRQAIFVGFLRALGDNDAVDEAQEWFNSVEQQQGNA